jgi:hypothetical protein
MGTRSLLFAIVVLVFSIVNAHASYCGPNGCAPPMMRPALSMPAPMPGPMHAVNCPPPCPPPMCAPPTCAPPSCGPAMCGQASGGGFNPFAALFSLVTAPFRIIGGLVPGRTTCAPPMCPPPGCMPVCMPDCGPAMAPITKVKAPARAAYSPRAIPPLGY